MDDTRTDVSEQSKEENDTKTNIENIVTNRLNRCRNSVLSSQIQKALPNVPSFEKQNSLHVALRQLSDELLMRKSKAKQKNFILQLPRKSSNIPQVAAQDLYISGSKHELFADAFVRKLPVSITEKRQYRKSIFVSLKKKPWYTKQRLQDFFEKKWENFLAYFDLWHHTLNVIEGQHGAAVVSYFLFVRWLLYMNIIIFILNFVFLVIPQISFPDTNSKNINNTSYLNENYFPEAEQWILKKDNYSDVSTEKEFDIKNSILMDNIEIFGKNYSTEVIKNCEALYALQVSDDTYKSFFKAFQSFLQGTGVLERTHLFIGFYSPFKNLIHGHIYYNFAAFLCVFVATFLTSLYMMLQYSSTGIQEAFTTQNKMSSFYSSRVFSAWEYSIKEPKCADQLRYWFVLDMKTSLNEDRTAKELIERSTMTRVKLYAVRFIINWFILMWLISCCYFIYSVTAFQMKEQQEQALSEPGLLTFLVQFSPSLTIVILNSISPTLFKILISFEKYTAQTEVNISIFRNVVLRLSSVIVLLNTFHSQVACKAKDVCGAGLDKTCRSPRCWETYIGQQLYKLSLTDLFVQVGVFLCSDTVKHYISKTYDNKFTRMIGSPVFFLPAEILAAINSQTILWLGVFYSPLLPVVMIFKLIIIFYIKKTKVLKYCEPLKSSYRAARINAMFIFILLISFFIFLSVQSFAIERIPPSRGCGPFRYFDSMTEAVPEVIRSWLSVLMSYWAITFFMFVLCVAIHYYWQVLVSQQALIDRLKSHLVLHSYDKQFLLKEIAKLTEGKSPETEKTVQT